MAASLAARCRSAPGRVLIAPLVLLIMASPVAPQGAGAAAEARPAAAVCGRAGAADRRAPSPAASGTDRGARPCSLDVFRLPSAMEPPVIDGRLDDAVWQDATVATGFVQAEPDPGEAATERTEARVAMDGRAIYVAMRMYDDAPDSIRAQFARRDDAEAVSDWAHVFIDSYHDRRTAFHFATTPRGARVDVLHLEDTETDPNWDAVWDVAATVDDEGWTAEFRIPLSQLRFSGDDTTWGINFMRQISRRSETSYWAPIPPESGRLVSLFGQLDGLRNLNPPRRLEFMPYTLARVTRAPGDAADPFYHATALAGDVGADLKYGLTSDLTLTATVNPDFGQVEADPSVVNLSAFETFYPEKRPFFTEGAEIFRFPLVPEGHLFYSRRVGRTPHGRASAPGGFVDAPETAPILAAAKVSGKTSGGWSLGFLNAVAGRAEANLVDSLGVEATQPVEPLTNYAVARVVRDFRRGRSGLGAMATATNRSIEAAGSLDFIPTASYAGAVNGWHRFGGSRFQLSGWLMGTHLRGSEDAIARIQRSGTHLFTRPDADHLTYDPTRTRLDGWAGELFMSKIGGGHWTWRLGGGVRSPGMDVNDAGFVSYTDTWYGSGILTYREFQPGAVFRNWRVQGQVVDAYSFALESIRPSAHLTMNGQLLNFWSGSIVVDHWRDHLWPWELRGGPALRVPAYTNVNATLRTDSRRSWQVGLSGAVREEYGSDGWQASAGPWITMRPSARAALEIRPSVAWTRNPQQYVSRVSNAGATDYVVALLDQTTASLTARLSYAFSADLALDVYAQPFLSDGRYTAFRTVADAGARRFNDRFALVAPSTLTYDAATDRYAVDGNLDGSADYTFSDPDFTVRELRSNVVLRWEYRPGSTLYVVWSQDRGDDVRLTDFAVGRDLERLLGAPSTNVVMVKLSYWFGA